jgi:hypothetical protein
VCHLDAEALPLEVVCKDGCPNRVSFVSQQLHQGLELVRLNLPSRVRVKLSPNQLEPKKVGLHVITRQKIRIWIRRENGGRITSEMRKPPLILKAKKFSMMTAMNAERMTL